MKNKNMITFRQITQICIKMSNANKENKSFC